MWQREAYGTELPHSGVTSLSLRQLRHLPPVNGNRCSSPIPSPKAPPQAPRFPFLTQASRHGNLFCAWLSLLKPACPKTKVISTLRCLLCPNTNIISTVPQLRSPEMPQPSPAPQAKPFGALNSTTGTRRGPAAGGALREVVARGVGAVRGPGAKTSPGGLLRRGCLR